MEKYFYIDLNGRFGIGDADCPGRSFQGEGAAPLHERFPAEFAGLRRRMEDLLRKNPEAVEVCFRALTDAKIYIS